MSPSSPSSTADEALRRLAQRRWRLAIALTAVMLVIYFGFIALSAYSKATMGTMLGDGLSLGILLGALVIVAAFVLTGIYVRWANDHYDPALRDIKARLSAEEPAKPGASS